MVRHSSVEENPNDESIESEIPKVYLKVQTVIEFDTFVATHGPFTNVDGSCDSEHTEPNSLKRKGGIKVESATRRSKQPAYFVSELAHVVAMCDERLPYVSLAKEVRKYTTSLHVQLTCSASLQLTNRKVFHQGVQVEANATGLVLKFIQLPPPTAEIGQSAAWHALLKRLLSASVRVLIKGVLKSWLVEFVFYSTPLSSTHPKEQGTFGPQLIFTTSIIIFINKLLYFVGSRRPIYFQYDMATIDNTSKTVDSLLNDWSQIVHLYTIVHDLSEYLKIG